MAPLLWVCLAVGCVVTLQASASCEGTLAPNTLPTTTENLTTVDSTVGGVRTIHLNLPPRYMWGWGGTLSGYCGSFSSQTAMLFYGKWVSAEYVRDAAGNNVTQVLLGNDFGKVATALGLVIDEFDNSGVEEPQAAAFLNWVATHIESGRPVIGGVFLKEAKGDEDYDHIVPIVGVQVDPARNAAVPVGGTGVSTNVSEVYYNDLWDHTTYRTLSGPLLAMPRQDWRSPTHTQPYDYALPYTTSYGVSILGLQDPKEETFRTMLSSWSYTEPDWGSEDGCNLAPQPIDFSVTVFGLTPGVAYSILRFEGNATTAAGAVTEGFLASGLWSRRWDFRAQAPQHYIELFDRVLSASIVTYRTVRSDGRSRVPKNPNALLDGPPNKSGGMVGSRVPLSLLVFGTFLAIVAGAWYLTKRYWSRKNPLYDPHSMATVAVRRQRAASHVDGTEVVGVSCGTTDEGSGQGEVGGVDALRQPLTDGDAAA